MTPSASGVGRLVGAAVRGRLHLVVGEPRRRAHQPAHEPVPAQPAVGVDPQVDGEARPVLARHQRAPAVGQVLRQHRHDAVGEVDRVAAAQGLAVERAARPDVPGDVGDGDQQVPAAAVVGVGVRLGPDRVVEVAGVLAVDGDQRNLAQVLPVAERRRPGGGRLGQGGVRKSRRDVVVLDGDQADGARPTRRAAALDDAGTAQAQRLALVHLRPDQLAGLGAHGVGDLELLLRPPIHRKQAAAAADELEDAERARPARRAGGE